MKFLIAILWFSIFTKALFFWVWLWQLKEYHFGRFRAHFETQKIKKVTSSFYWIKFPKFTKKTIVILFSGILLEILTLFYIFSLPNRIFYPTLLILLILSPIIFSRLILSFQIPTVILRNRILKKARRKIAKFENLLVIGITGSYGKTSTKEFLAEMLSKKFKVLKTKKHVNAEIGVAQTILNELTREHEIFIAEIGAYEIGKIKQVCKMLKPKIGILTGINEQHLSTFGSQENIIKAKFELIESLPQDGLAIFNGNNRYCQELFQRTRIAKKNVYSGRNSFNLIKKNLFPFDVENVLMAIAVAKYLGMNVEEIDEALSKIKSPIEIKKGVFGLNIINSTHSANPNSVIAHLDYLKKWKGKKIIIMPCLIELGRASREIHQRIGEKIGKVCDLAIITTGDRFKELEEGAQKAGMPKENILVLEKPKEIFEKIRSFCSSGDIILLESRLSQSLVKMLVE